MLGICIQSAKLRRELEKLKVPSVDIPDPMLPFSFATDAQSFPLAVVYSLLTLPFSIPHDVIGQFGDC